MWPQLWTQCESPEIHCTSCHAFLKATGFGCALYWFILFALLFTKLRCRSNTITWSCCSSGTSPNILTLKHSSSVVQNELTGWEGNLSLYTTLESLLICSFKNTDLFVKKLYIWSFKDTDLFVKIMIFSCPTILLAWYEKIIGSSLNVVCLSVFISYS